MMLANIINGRPPKNDEGPKTTLIVATAALVLQWKSEIPKHCHVKKGKGSSRSLKVMVYHGKHKLETNDDAEMLLEFDIV